MKKVKYIVNKPIHGYKAGQEVSIVVDDNGTPVDRLWRRRARDAKIDGCVEIVVEPQSSKVKTKTAEKDD